jgi:hypothetical protein
MRLQHSKDKFHRFLLSTLGLYLSDSEGRFRSKRQKPSRPPIAFIIVKNLPEVADWVISYHRRYRDGLLCLSMRHGIISPDHALSGI